MATVSTNLDAPPAAASVPASPAIQIFPVTFSLQIPLFAHSLVPTVASPVTPSTQLTPNASILPTSMLDVKFLPRGMPESVEGAAAGKAGTDVLKADAPSSIKVDRSSGFGTLAPSQCVRVEYSLE